MAHISGYGGTLVFTGTDVPTWDASVLAWTVRQFVNVHAVPVQQNTDTPRITGRDDWSADVRFLVQTGIVANDMNIGGTIVCVFHFDAGGVPNLSGTGILESVSIDDPLDGPVVGTAKIVSSDSKLVTNV